MITEEERGHLRAGRKRRPKTANPAVWPELNSPKMVLAELLIQVHMERCYYLPPSRASILENLDELLTVI